MDVKTYLPFVFLLYTFSCVCVCVCVCAQGVENVYTRHKPLINDTLEALIKRKLPESLYPFAGKKSYSDRPQDVIIFIVGGATYAEAMAVANINRSNQSVRIILGSNTIVNSQQ